MKNVINISSFQGKNTEFKAFLDNANNGPEEELEESAGFPYYECSNCGYRTWVIKKDMPGLRCVKCGALVTILTRKKIKDKPHEQEKKLVSTRYGFKRI